MGKALRKYSLADHGRITRDLNDKQHLLSTRISNLNPKKLDGFLMSALGESQQLLTEIRNLSIYTAHLNGQLNKDIANILFLSDARVSQIINQMKKEYGMTNQE